MADERYLMRERNVQDENQYTVCSVYEKLYRNLINYDNIILSLNKVNNKHEHEFFRCLNAIAL